MNMRVSMPVSSWGRLYSPTHSVEPLLDRARVAHAVRASAPGLAYGNGRSYGDVCLNPGGTLWTMRGLDRFIEFDPANGRLECEAGILLADIIKIVLPQGWFLPVTPGTQFVTVGGAIANDVHGKNHHRLGTFGRHVSRFELVRTDGTVLRCAPDENADWYGATIGGLGLTGVITRAELQLRPVPGPWLEVEYLPFGSIDEFFALADDSEEGFEYTVAWVDCAASGSRLGRGIFMRGNHAPGDDPAAPPAARRMWFTPPFSLVNRLSLRIFNALYYSTHRLRAGRRRVPYLPYFYPLDYVFEWNRIYGPKGFFQYQSVVPRIASRDATREMLVTIARSGAGSFLAVLKTFGNVASPGWLSFPMPGTTLALDFPNHGASTEALFRSLDAIVRAAGGRLYPAKDARMPRDLFVSGYPRLDDFLRYRDTGIRSAFWQRLMPEMK